jgi:hypothetical protein
METYLHGCSLVLDGGSLFLFRDAGLGIAVSKAELGGKINLDLRLQKQLDSGQQYNDLEQMCLAIKNS